MGAFVCVCFKKLESRHTHGQFTFCEIIWPAGDCKYLFSAPFTMSSVTIRIGSDSVTLVLVPILTEKCVLVLIFKPLKTIYPQRKVELNSDGVKSS